MAKYESQGDEALEDSETEESSSGSDEKILEQAKKRLKVCEDAERTIREEALADMKFSAGEQWDPAVVLARRAKRRPCLTINRLPGFIRQITNDQRQNRPSIKVHPVDDKGDPETAKIIQGLIRHIEYNSNADSARDTAFDGSVRGGFGYYRVVTEYENPKSFNQEILIKRIRNPLSVFFDPYASEPDGSDANWAFVVEDLSKEEFKAKYPKAKLSTLGDWDSIGNQAPDWFRGGDTRVAEYFYKEFKEETLLLLSNGDSVLEKDLPAYLESAPNLAPIQVVDRRKTDVPGIKWCKLTANEVLEKTDWPGIYIPIIPVYGEEIFIDGKRTLKGIVRDAKDSQQMLNVWKSAETEAIGLAPKAPFIAAEGQIENYRAIWETSNNESHAVLPYKPIALGGVPVPPPQRQTFEPAIQAITQAALGAADDLKATTGLYDAARGAQSNETSGRAIMARANQAQTSNFHFTDNLTRSIRHEGRILIDLIPHIYDTARAARIVGEDGEQKVVKLNQDTGQKDKYGKPLVYNLSAGKYDVTVDVGPSYASKRQEAASSMLELSKASPMVMQVAPDLLVKNMDWPGATEIAERFKKTLPPNLIDDPAQQGQQVPPQVQAQMQQMSQMVEQLTAKLNEAQDQIQQKRIELESKERIEMAKLETSATIELAKLQSLEAVKLLTVQVSELNQRQKQLGSMQPIPDVTQDPMAPQPPLQDPSLPPPSDGAMGAEPGSVGMSPTGGVPPEQPTEGNF